MLPSQTLLPRIWLMTDECMGERLWEALQRLPAGHAGVVFRHYAAPDRQTLGQRITTICADRGLTLAVAGDVELARSFKAQLVHNPRSPAHELPFSVPVHSLREAEAARTLGATLVFVSPIHPTRSHPGGTALGDDRAIEIARAAGVPAIALGGMNAHRFAKLEKRGFYGWAAIDAWLES